MSSRFDVPKPDDRPEEAEDRSLSLLQVGNEKYLFMYSINRESLENIITTANDFANNPELSFSRKHADAIIATVRGQLINKESF